MTRIKSPQTFFLANHQKISTPTEPLGKGGEGNVYEILSPQYLKHCVVKIYHPRERNTQREEKLHYMIQNTPHFADDYALIWPRDIVYQNGVFVGFLMLRARGEHDLTVLSSLKIPKHLEDDWHRVYSRDHLQGLQARVRLCYHIAEAVQQLHKTQQYILIDLKPENIKVNLKGEISILDLDSIEIVEGKKLLFPAQKLSTEYSPAEMNALKSPAVFIPETWDRFSLGVIFYKILLGIHPFAVTGKGNYAQLSSHAQKIQAGLFPHGYAQGKLAVVPKPHDNFQALPLQMQHLFKNCLDYGSRYPVLRPQAEDWLPVLKEEQEWNIQMYQALGTPGEIQANPYDVLSFKIPKNYPFVQPEVLFLGAISMSSYMFFLSDSILLGSLPISLGLYFSYVFKAIYQIQIDKITRKLFTKSKNILGFSSKKTYRLDDIHVTTIGNPLNEDDTWFMTLYEENPMIGRRKISEVVAHRKNKAYVKELLDTLDQVGVPIIRGKLPPP